ncbi:Uncharacterized protein Fot_05512 [Forsythia ovata]|uniref:Uncharacterized protein n=1 Tax=Forsythia ovata TaxID=205694 RepID=A0ABD1WQD7_9LAMI
MVHELGDDAGHIRELIVDFEEWSRFTSECSSGHKHQNSGQWLAYVSYPDARAARVACKFLFSHLALAHESLCDVRPQCSTPPLFNRPVPNRQVLVAALEGD